VSDLNPGCPRLLQEVHVLTRTRDLLCKSQALCHHAMPLGDTLSYIVAKLFSPTLLTMTTIVTQGRSPLLNLSFQLKHTKSQLFFMLISLYLSLLCLGYLAGKEMEKGFLGKSNKVVTKCPSCSPTFEWNGFPLIYLL